MDVFNSFKKGYNIGKNIANAINDLPPSKYSTSQLREYTQQQIYRNYKGTIDQYFKKDKKRLNPDIKTTSKKKVRKMARKAKGKGKARSSKVRVKRLGSRKWRFKRKNPPGRAINVKEDKEGYSKTYRQQKVTKQQQKLINRRFKGSYSPFKDVFETGFQETMPQATGECKWVWRCYNHLEYLARAFKFFPVDTSAVSGAPAANQTDSYQNSPTQAVYFNKFKTTYEIVNPTNYDMNLVIYDLVAKQDSTNSAANANYNKWITNSASLRNPVRCIELGLNPQYGQYTSGASSSTGTYPIVADSNMKTLYDITLKPTESYPFNIYWTIVKKHTFKLQPGATLTHVFIHKPKALMTRGYIGYRYGKDMVYNDGDRNRAIKDITSGCLFKFWGQVAGTSLSTGTGPSGTGEYTNMTQDHDDVTTLSGRLMFKEYIDNRWYCMDPKFTYTFKTDIAKWAPQDEETMEVSNNATIKKAVDTEDHTDNNDGAD